MKKCDGIKGYLKIQVAFCYRAWCWNRQKYCWDASKGSGYSGLEFIVSMLYLSFSSFR
ncbi:hypothetical protein EIKCOROL_01287 [Eikenella corrodens ATCC 23834]|uniref:Uncharacterized protein n=1 Tax=Eikenella corrodens ATCC 23834 TaxID=546274 RepID=C0DV98_EIKCO|nr:hypothetical protein EIKCOROL_01287 [Eikenella corrodens ATCC 23834]